MPSADQEVFDLLATRCLSGEASGRERQRLRELTKTPEWKARFSRMQRNWNAAKAPTAAGFDLKAAVKRLAAGIAAEAAALRRARTPKAKAPQPRLPARQRPARKSGPGSLESPPAASLTSRS